MDTPDVVADRRVRLDEVRPDPKQPRSYFKDSALKALAASIKSIGQRTPIEVRRLPKGSAARFEIIDGERRWRACKMIGQATIRICIEEADLDHHRQHLLSLVSNFHREGHTHMETSTALQYQLECAEKADESRTATIAKLADHLGKSTTWVNNYLYLQNLAPELQAKMHPETPDKQLLRFGEAGIIANLEHAQQLNIYLRMLKVPVQARVKLARELAAEISGDHRRLDRSHPKRTVERATKVCAVCGIPGCIEARGADFHHGSSFGDSACNYTGLPPFANASWANDADALCFWCAGTGHPYADESYGICACPKPANN